MFKNRNLRIHPLSAKLTESKTLKSSRSRESAYYRGLGWLWAGKRANVAARDVTVASIRRHVAERRHASFVSVPRESARFPASMQYELRRAVPSRFRPTTSFPLTLNGHLLFSAKQIIPFGVPFRRTDPFWYLLLLLLHFQLEITINVHYLWVFLTFSF